MKLWNKTKDWFKRHKTGVKYTLIGVGSFAGGLIAMRKIDYALITNGVKKLEDEDIKELAKMSDVQDIASVKLEEDDDPTAWNKDWDEMAVQFELLTHQPLGSFTNGYTEEEGYVDPLNGNCFIIAGCNSCYNESPDQLDYYVLDNEGWYHRMPDELRT